MFYEKNKNEDTIKILMLENSEQNDRKSRLPSRRHKRPEHSLQLYMTTRTGGLSVLQIPSAWIQMC